jgi:hypothetical protein
VQGHQHAARAAVDHLDTGRQPVVARALDLDADAPAVGAAVAADLVGDEPPIDLTPYRLSRFAGGVAFPETLIL